MEPTLFHFFVRFFHRPAISRDSVDTHHEPGSVGAVITMNENGSIVYLIKQIEKLLNVFCARHSRVVKRD